MAFRQPTLAPAVRQPAPHTIGVNAPSAPNSVPHCSVEESHEWVLFPTANGHSTAQTQRTTSSARTPTAGLSRLSDFGSLDAKSRRKEAIPQESTDGSLDDEELDSLDEGLQAFQDSSLPQRSSFLEQSGSILPRHDGLGTFPASSPPVQEQLWHFEQYNPRKRSLGHHRWRPSVQGRLDAAEEDDATSIEVERRERIEKWRMEQSRLLMDEIEKETRRRRASFTSQRVGHAPATAPLEQVIEDTINAHIGDNVATAPLNACPPATEDSETFWQRVTRRVIRDFIGFDDNLLSIIFGESLPAENPVSSHSYLVPSSSTRLDNFVPPPSICSGWERRLLDRLVRELGILVQQLSVHPGAFSVPYNPSTTDYAGMPITAPTSSRTQTKSHAPSVNTAATTTNPHSFDFQPTLRNAEVLPPTSTADSTHAALWGIEEEPAPILEDDRDYWEQTPDIKTVFRFLHNRLTSQRRPATTSKPPLNIATTSTPDSLRRAAIIRQYHPLVFRAAAAWEQRHGHARRHGLLRGRSGCSCASSIGGSVRRGVGLRAGSLGSSSRNYWDIGGSTVGSGGGSAIGVGGGGMGAWGEV